MIVSHKVESWVRPAGKQEIIDQVWGGEIPKRLWYYLGFVQEISRDLLCQTAGQLFDRDADGCLRNIGFGQSEFLPGGPTVFMVIDADRVPLEIRYGNIVCPLYAVGIQNHPGYINFVDPSLSEQKPSLDGMG